ncbi:hypothetical protein [Nitrobacter sp.]|jgi:hypothetical protein|uniref:hypothetical protein n=1 Tax=Nitrobacter sp. TaxID=29420 RepID=UPI003F649232
MGCPEDHDEKSPPTQHMAEQQPNEGLVDVVRRIKNIVGDDCEESDAFSAYKRIGSVVQAVAFLRDPVNVEYRRVRNLEYAAIMRTVLEEEFQSLQDELDTMIEDKDCGENVPDREFQRVRDRHDRLGKFLAGLKLLDSLELSKGQKD